ncbi:iron-containing alcohol dehydrogenase family protein [Botrimarina sp.]|uniref:iron-containing alcohol dehydrogenase family protein n=1 Tax=Botrimarina sp. TaxID=2795802 RepID=UPI0032EF1F70
MGPAQVDIPSFVRIKPGALGRLGLYAARHERAKPALLASAGLPDPIMTAVRDGFAERGIAFALEREVEDPSFAVAADLLAELPAGCDSVFGVGGGRALDVAKYVASLAGAPYYSVPTSLSNDGFCAPQSSLALQGRRKSLPCRMPFAVVVDTAVCSDAPEVLWWSGVGDLIAKLTAVQDWKLAYHERGEAVDDLAALLSTSTVYQFIARPHRDAESLQVMATALMISGVAMAICGSSRPASGAEHLISHALDRSSKRPRYHGLQVGVAAYLTSRLHGGGHTATIARLFDDTRFWDGIRAEPFSRDEWLEATRAASQSQCDRFTILQHRDCVGDVEAMIDSDPRLAGCFT